MIYGNPLIFGGSGGGSDTYAFIIVTYPSGSTCTATDGTTTLTAPDTSGSWVCKVPAAGTWTILSTDGSQTASTAVTISTEGQRESVTLEYRVYLFKAGDQCTDITGGWNISGWSYSGATVTAGTIAGGKMSLGGVNTLAALASDLAVPISGRTKLVAEVSGLSAVGSYASGVLEIYDSKGAISTPRDLAYALINNNTSHVLAEIDLTSLTQTSVFVVTHVSGAVSTYQYEVYNIWLE